MISNEMSPFFPQFAGAAGMGLTPFAGAPTFGGFGPSSQGDRFNSVGELPEQRLRAYQGGGAMVFAFAAMQQTNAMNGAYAHNMGCSCYSCVAVFAVGFAAPSRIEEDPYGISQSGQGQRSNLANSPEVMLAMKDLMSDGKNRTYDEIATELKDKYGIECEVGEIVSTGKDGKETKTKGIKFGNGDYFVDGNGNGALDSGDYKFDDAVKNIKEKYGLADGDIKGITDRMKENAKIRAEWNKGGFGRQGGFGGYGGQMGGFGGYGQMGGFGVPQLGGPFAGMGQMGGFSMPGFDMQWMMMFMQAWQQARVA